MRSIERKPKLEHLAGLGVALAFVIAACARAPGPEAAPPGVDAQAGTNVAAHYDPCADKVCGDPCQLCPPNAEPCEDPGGIRHCNAAGECRHEPPACAAHE